MADIRSQAKHRRLREIQERQAEEFAEIGILNLKWDDVDEQVLTFEVDASKRQSTSEQKIVHVLQGANGAEVTRENRRSNDSAPACVRVGEKRAILIP